MVEHQFDLELGIKLRDKAIEQTHKHNESWVDRVVREIKGMAAGSTFTTDALWGRVPDPPEPRAMGAAMRHAKRLGLVVPTSQHEQSARPACHARPVRVWRRTWA